jgi:hypothetical protein
MIRDRTFGGLSRCQENPGDPLTHPLVKISRPGEAPRDLYGVENRKWRRYLRSTFGGAEELLLKRSNLHTTPKVNAPPFHLSRDGNNSVVCKFPGGKPAYDRHGPITTGGPHRRRRGGQANPEPPPFQKDAE